VAGLQFGLRQSGKTIFLGLEDFSALPQAVFVFSPRAERGLGNECARALGRGYFFQSLMNTFMILDNPPWRFCP